MRSRSSAASYQPASLKSKPGKAFTHGPRNPGVQAQALSAVPVACRFQKRGQLGVVPCAADQVNRGSQH